MNDATDMSPRSARPKPAFSRADTLRALKLEAEHALREIDMSLAECHRGLAADAQARAVSVAAPAVRAVAPVSPSPRASLHDLDVAVAHAQRIRAELDELIALLESMRNGAALDKAREQVSAPVGTATSPQAAQPPRQAGLVDDDEAWKVAAYMVAAGSTREQVSRRLEVEFGFADRSAIVDAAFGPPDKRSRRWRARAGRNT